MMKVEKNGQKARKIKKMLILIRRNIVLLSTVLIHAI